MTNWNEGEAAASPITRKLEQSASVTTDKMVQVDLSATESSREGAPRKRGLLGPLTELFARASVRVWAPVLGKALGTLGMLSFVALLGFHSRADDTYGAVISAETNVGSGPLGNVQTQAAPVADPEKKETLPPLQCPVPPPCPDGATAGGKPKAAGVTEDGKIILNEASVDELTRLPGVGQARAEAIVALRERLKGFRKVSDLLRIRGIGWRTLEKMKDKLVLDRKAPEAQEKGDPVPEKG